MANHDILSNFFKDDLNYNKIINNSIKPISKKRNYLKKYNIFNTENNILKFNPKFIKKDDNLSITIKPYNYHNQRQPMTNKEIVNQINKKQKKAKSFINNNINNINIYNLNQFQNNKDNNMDIIPLNNEYHDNKTTSTNFKSTYNNINRKGHTIKNKKILTKLLYKTLNNKVKNVSNIDKEANKIVNYYMNTDISNIKNKIKINFEESNKIEKVKNNIKNKYLMDKKLLKMKNIRHKLMEGQYSDFRSINIQKKALGEEKHRNNLLRSIGDYYVNQAYQPLNQYIIDKKYKKNKFLEKDKITKEFDFEKNKVRIALSEKIKRKKDLKNRGNISLNLTSFNGIKLNKKDYQNFYENLNCLTHRVKNTYEHIKKNIEIRQKYRDDINNLFLVYNFNI